MPRDMPPLGEFEQMVLLAVLCAEKAGEAYGITVYDELTVRTTRRIARGAVYMTLDRLEKKGLLTSYLTEPTAARGGRADRTRLFRSEGRKAEQVSQCPQATEIGCSRSHG